MRLGPGSYMLQPGGNYRHITSCGKDSECVFFVESDGPFDLKLAQEKGNVVESPGVTSDRHDDVRKARTSEIKK